MTYFKIFDRKLDKVKFRFYSKEEKNELFKRQYLLGFIIKKETTWCSHPKKKKLGNFRYIFIDKTPRPIAYLQLKFWFMHNIFSVMYVLCLCIIYALISALISRFFTNSTPVLVLPRFWPNSLIYSYITLLQNSSHLKNSVKKIQKSATKMLKC